ncbi:transposase [Candidatus Kaiserbacteria bacterium]|nr:transposase [Candidatus Kaiserbacteria bacterium]
MANRAPIEVDEWYHCYNRGVDKRKVFQSHRDYQRMLVLMYVANDTTPIRVLNLGNKQLGEIISSATRARVPLVDIGAYSLMPNHFHFLLKEIQAGGIALFMQKVFTGYTMYFNKKAERTGALFAGTFKSKHVAGDDYIRQLVPYVHLNCIELFDANWKTGGSIVAIEQRLRKYPYSSLPDFLGTERPERSLLGTSIFKLFEFPIDLDYMLDEARAYYASTSKV